MFEGITPAASEFLFALALHNEREWFMPRKEEFKALVDTPLRSLAAETLDLMRGQFPEEDFQPHVSRIYRDARRLHGGGPYRDHLWFSLQSGDTRANGPMFWFELTAVSYAYGMGFWTRGNAEICLLATKGKPKRRSAGVHQLIVSPIERHSQKPEEARDKIIALMGELPRIELFARQETPGWDVWGNEVENSIVFE